MIPSICRLEALKVRGVLATASFPSDVVWEALVELELIMWSKDWDVQCNTGWLLIQSHIIHELGVSAS